jgi:hypothetical protein
VEVFTMIKSRLVEVYRAKNSFQAHLLRSALENEGIPALVQGDLLQGALEAPADWFTAPRIVVEAADAPRARTLLEQWEHTRPAAVSED